VLKPATAGIKNKPVRAPTTLVTPSAFWPFGFFAEDLVNHLSELAVRRRLWGWGGRGDDFSLQVQHKGLQPLTAGLEFFDFKFQMPDLGSQGGRDFCFIHDKDAHIESRSMPDNAGDDKPTGSISPALNFQRFFPCFRKMISEQ
jgi:hypothetical protein